MAKKDRPIRMQSDPAEEKIVENHIDYAHQVGARFQNLWPDTRAEKISSIPIAPPVGYKKQPSMVDHIRGLVRSEHLRWAAESSGAETFEEADDFEIDDDDSPRSPYEENFEPTEPGPPTAPPSPSDAPDLKAGTPPEGVGSQPATPPPPAPKPPGNSS